MSHDCFQNTKSEDQLRSINDILMVASAQFFPFGDRFIAAVLDDYYDIVERLTGESYSFNVPLAYLTLAPDLGQFCHYNAEANMLVCPSAAYHYFHARHLELRRDTPELASTLVYETICTHCKTASFSSALKLLRRLWRTGWFPHYYECGLLLAELWRASILKLPYDEFCSQCAFVQADLSRQQQQGRVIFDPGTNGTVYAKLDTDGCDMSLLAESMLIEIQESEEMLLESKESCDDVNLWFETIHNLLPFYVAAVEIFSEVIASVEDEILIRKCQTYRLLAEERRVDIVSAFSGLIMPDSLSIIDTLFIGIPLQESDDLEYDIHKLDFSYLSRAFMPRIVYLALKAAMRKGENRKAAWKQAWAARRAGLKWAMDDRCDKTKTVSHIAVNNVGSYRDFWECLRFYSHESEGQCEEAKVAVEKRVEENRLTFTAILEQRIKSLAELVDRGHVFDEGSGSIGPYIALALSLDRAFQKNTEQTPGLIYLIRDTLLKATTSKKASMKTHFPIPLPNTDPQVASQLNVQYQRLLADWKSLPWWKRLRTKRPEPPTDI